MKPLGRAILGSLAGLGAAVLAMACGSSSGGACSGAVPSSCPTPAPSYAQDVVPIIQASCFPCHATGGIEAAHFDYSTYAGLSSSATEVYTQVDGCMMPPSAPIPGTGVDAGSPPLTAQARLTLLTWVICGAPDN